MCGFAAIIGPDDTAKDVAAAMRKIQHRGPDSSGSVLIKSSMETTISLGHSRLSILDLSEGGLQPQTSPCGNYTLVFNGEIYNYIEIRKVLRSQGVQFKSESDTEVLLQAYIAWGRECLTRLTGMFAFAIVDKKRQEVFAARDYFGIKPLYYSRQGKSLILASEIKAILTFGKGKNKANSQRCFDYLRGLPTDYGEETFFDGILQIPAGHFAVFSFEGEKLAIERYWQVETKTTTELSFEDAAKELREKFLDSVALHLRSDVPIGTALSGGVDSTSILCAIRYLDPAADLHAFSFISSNKATSEEKWIDIASQAVSAVTHKIRPTADELVQDIDELISMQDEPFGSTSIYAQYRVFKEVKKFGIKVLLDGQGADEIFAGYRGFGPTRVVSEMQKGRFLASLNLIRNLATSPSTSLNHVIKQTISHYVPTFAMQAAYRAVGRPLVPSWLNSGWVHRHSISTAPLFSVPRSGNYLKESLKMTLEQSSVPMLLRYEDRDSMAHSIESRVPFLSHELVQFAYSLPERYLLDDQGLSKAVFRKAMRGIVPDAILDRRDKIGFETPEQEWLYNLQPWIDAVLNSPRAKSIPLFHHSVLREDWFETLAGKRRFDFRIWRWVNFIKWAEINNVSFDGD